MKPTVIALGKPWGAFLWRWGWLGLALLVSGYSWWRAASFDAPTGPRRVTWRDAEDRVINPGVSAGVTMQRPMILGDRLIVQDWDSKAFAWISPRQGQAKLAWPLPAPLRGASSLSGLAVRDAETFAFAETHRDNFRGEVYVGISGAMGWSRAPAPVVRWELPDGWASSQPTVLGMAWIGGELELVLTHNTADDPFGRRHPPDVVRIPERGAPVIRSHPLPCEDCSVLGALPTDRGWKLIAASSFYKTEMMIDAAGAVTPLPPELAWWTDDRARDDSELTRLGSLERDPGRGYVVHRDGSRRAEPPPPMEGFVPQSSPSARLELVDGELHTRQLYRREGTRYLLAQRAAVRAGDGRSIGERVFYIDSSPADSSVQLVGAHPDRLRPALYHSSLGGFRGGVFLPGPGGGYYWVSGAGEYVTLDEQLRRVDPLPLLQHQRAPAARGHFIGKPSPVRYLAWALFGLPLCLAGGALIVWVGRRNKFLDGKLELKPISKWRLQDWLDELAGLRISSLLYAISGALALHQVLPLL